MATAKETAGNAAEDLDFLSGFAGEGLDGFGAGTTSTPYLSMVQPGSACAGDDDPPGTWRNSATGHNYGNLLRVTVLGFRTVWNERSSEAPYPTVANYMPNSIEVERKSPPAGQRGFTKMYNPQTGNEIKELFLYAVSLPEYPEDGVLVFSPTVSSMRTCRQWNTQLKGQILPNGVQAPIFGYSWDLVLELVDNPKQKGSKMTMLTRAVKGPVTSKDCFERSVRPLLPAVKGGLLEIGAGETVEQEEE